MKKSNYNFRGSVAAAGLSTLLCVSPPVWAQSEEQEAYLDGARILFGCGASIEFHIKEIGPYTDATGMVWSLNKAEAMATEIFLEQGLYLTAYAMTGWLKKNGKPIGRETHEVARDMAVPMQAGLSEMWRVSFEEGRGKKEFESFFNETCLPAAIGTSELLDSLNEADERDRKRPQKRHVPALANRAPEGSGGVKMAKVSSTVPARNGAQLPITVFKGTRLYFSVKGKWCWGRGATECTNGNGTPGRPSQDELPVLVAGSEFGTLIGKAGECYFSIGQSSAHVMPCDGPLSLVMNDRVNAYSDNHGSLEVEITWIK